MRRLFLYIGILIAFSGVTWALKASAQQEKEAILRLNKNEIEALYSIIDESATPGSIRKPLLQKIEIVYRATFAPQQPIKSDTTKPKKN